ncbi:MAG: HAMP domain-containing protein, partial [bacterium]
MTIKRKLFLTFLLLAFLPASGLVWLSYYLATEGSKLLASPGVTETLAAGDSLAMWALAQQQEQLAVDLEQLAESAVLDPPASLRKNTGLDLIYLVQPDSIVLLRGGDFPEMREALTSTAATAGRLVLDDRLLIWQRTRLNGTSLVGGRFLPPEYFRLANRLLEGQTNYHSLSRTLLPVGQDLLLKIAVGLTLVFLILALTAAQTLSHALAAPLNRLVLATRKISRGDLSHRIPAGAQDEVGTLVDNFNLMTENLEQTTSNLLAAEREMAWKETARTIAHEIKNLLTPVNVTLFRIRKQFAEESTVDPQVEQSVAALTEEIEAVAELAREFSLFAHPTRLARTEVDLRSVVEAALALQSYDESRHSIEVSLPSDPEPISADRDLLRRVLSNLLKNSLEATPYGGHVIISAQRGANELALSIRDDGPGADEAIDLALPYITTKKSGT